MILKVTLWIWDRFQTVNFVKKYVFPSQCPLSNCTVRAGLGNLSHFKQSNHTEISRLLNFGVKTPSWSNFRNNSKKYSMNFGNLRQICNCVHPRKLIQNESTSSQFPLQNCTDRTSKMTRFHQGTQQKKWRETPDKKNQKNIAPSKHHLLRKTIMSKIISKIYRFKGSSHIRNFFFTCWKCLVLPFWPMPSFNIGRGTYQVVWRRIWRLVAYLQRGPRFYLQPLRNL